MTEKLPLSQVEVAAVDFCSIFAKRLLNRKKIVESKKVCHISLTKLSKEVSGSSKSGPCFLFGLSLLLGFRHPGNDVADQFIRSEIAPHLFFPVLILLQTLLGIVGRITIESSQETDVAAMNIQDNEVIVTVINVQPDAYTSSVPIRAQKRPRLRSFLCPGQDLNLHALKRALPPQSSVSTNSTTWAGVPLGNAKVCYFLN